MAANRDRGVSLIELMIAMTLGLLLLAGLVTIFTNASQTQRELQRTAQQIENGRYAMDILTQDLHHAGYYGQFYTFPAGTALQDDCATDAATITTAMSLPIRAIRAADLVTAPASPGASCATWFTAANLQPGSDVLVVRRAETSALAVGSASVNNEVYIQANTTSAEIQLGNNSTTTATSKADGSAATIKKKDGATAAEIRKFHTHIYFVAPCSIPAGGGDICTGSSDDGGKPIPTLKRLELSVSSSGTRTLNVVPIAEGIEFVKYEFGIDNSPATANATTGLIGDGAPDSYINTTPTAADIGNIVAARIFLLARNNETSTGYTDTKTYSLGAVSALTWGPASDAYKRHAYSSEVRLINQSARRENPP